MKLSVFGDLLPLIEQCVYHSESIKGLVTSGIFVNLPINGQMDHIIHLKRKVFAEVNANSEELFTPIVLLGQIEYILDKAERFEDPIYQQNEDGEEVHIGNSFIFIDRNRLVFPRVVQTTDGYILDCVKEKQ